MKMRVLLKMWLIVAGLAVVLAAPGRTWAEGKVPPEIVDLQKQIETVAETVGKSVVSITTMGKAEAEPDTEIPYELLPKEWRKFFQQPEQGPRHPAPRGLVPHGLGSGVIISKDGYILTNQHVIAGAEKVVVTTADRRKFPGKVIGADTRSDLAIVKIEQTNLTPAVLDGDQGEIKRGLFVVAIGNPFGFGADGEASVSFGIVSGTRRSLPLDEEEKEIRYYGNLIQTDAAINPGNSGGPLCDLEGRVIGIDVAIASRTGGSQGVGFAVPIDPLSLAIIEQLKKGETVVYGFLGVGIINPTEDESKAAGAETGIGAFVQKVESNSPAEKAGLMPADLITEINGKAIQDADDLVMTVGRTAPGKEVTLTVLRSGKKIEVKVKVAKRDLRETAATNEKGEETATAGAFPWRGLSLRDLTAADQQSQGENAQGVYVERVDDKSGAFERGVRAGMIISQVKSMKVKDLEEFKKAVEKIKGPVFVNVVGEGPIVVPE
jgi:serine protease Do